MTRLQKGHLYKAYGAWHVRYRDNVWQQDGTTKRIQISKRIASLAECPRKAEARLLAEEIMDKVNIDRASPCGTMPLARFVEDIYLPHAESQRRASTFHGYGHLWEKHLRPRVAEVWVRDFRTWDGERLLQRIASESNLSRATLMQIKSLLSAIFKHAKRCGAINGVNPMQDVSIPGNAKGPGETFAYSLEEVQRMLSLLPEPIATVIATAAFTGLRKGELRALAWENYSGKEIRVTQSLWETHVSEPKTRSSKAPIPVIAPLAAMLERHRQAAGNPATGWVFAAPGGGPIHLDNLVRRIIVPVLGKAGVKWRGWHAFRRGLATNLYGMGIPDKTIQMSE